MKTIKLITAMLLISKIFRKDIQLIEFEDGEGSGFNYILVDSQTTNKSYISYSDLLVKSEQYDNAQRIISNF